MIKTNSEKLLSIVLHTVLISLFCIEIVYCYFFSNVAYLGKINFDDFQRERSFKEFREYATSKLANLLFTFELQKRSDAGQWGLTVTAAHPGYAKTERKRISGEEYYRICLNFKVRSYLV